METMIASVGTNILISLGYSLVSYMSKFQNGESFNGWKMGRTASVGIALGIAANLSGFELTQENWETFAAANAGVIATTDKLFTVLLKSKALQRFLPVLILAASLGCASLPPVEDIREQLDVAEVTLVVVEEIAAELELEGIASTKDVEKLRDGTAKITALIKAARVLLDEGNRKDAVTTLIKLNRLIIDLQRDS